MLLSILCKVISFSGTVQLFNAVKHSPFCFIRVLNSSFGNLKCTINSFYPQEYYFMKN